MQPLLDHLKFFAHYLGGEDRRILVGLFLLDLGFPQRRPAFPIVRDAVYLFSLNPHQLLSYELYPEVARWQGPGHNGKQVEAAIRRELKLRWKERDQEKWQLYFPFGLTSRPNGPTNAEFLSALVILMDVWESCRRKKEEEKGGVKDAK